MENPIKDDWTEQVKLDLKDFQIAADLRKIGEKSQNCFKNHGKVKAAEYEYRRLITIKQTHSKMDNLKYSKLQMQGYLKLKNSDTKGAKILFKYRTRMARYGENYRMNGTPVLCPLCGLHLDNQVMAFNNCPEIKANVDIKGTYEDIFKPSPPAEVIKSLENIDQFRQHSTAPTDPMLGASFSS